MFSKFLEHLIVIPHLTSVTDEITGRRTEVADNTAQIVNVGRLDVAIVDKTNPNGSGGADIWADLHGTGIRSRIAQLPTQAPYRMQVGQTTVTIKHEGKA